MIWIRFSSFCFYFSLIFSPFLVQGQQSTHTAGGDGSSSTGSVAVSIGQVAYGSHSVGTGTKTLGVQQRYDLVQVKSATEPSLVQTNWSKAPILPSKVTIVLTEGQSFQVGVTWDKSTLNLFARGTYTLFGALSLPKYIGNLNLVRAQIKVQVLPKAPPLGLTLSNNSFEASKTNFFINVGAFLVNDAIDNIHVVSLNGDGYDNSYFEIQNNILYWNSAKPAPGKSTFSIVARVTDRDGNTLDKFFDITRTRPEFEALVITNTFSPNGDRANETWGVPDLRVYAGVRVFVFEKDGIPLFYTENPDDRWDGTYKGKEMPIGTYYWVIEILETSELRRGVLNLIRK
jgi:gliding motility-associated-like protein|uniref:T9SS type B sorting domain-containing protein n=1 Tax=Algoriphagus sp. TaxID=1872435 RepID=UPI0040488B0B